VTPRHAMWFALLVIVASVIAVAAFVLTHNWSAAVFATSSAIGWFCAYGIVAAAQERRP
jgi:uncharacterized membrane protein YbjE (DUF340 family)